MNPKHDNSFFSHPVLENGVFWIALILLSMGVITTFYYQDAAAIKTVSPHIYQYRQPANQETTSPRITVYDEDTGTPRTIILSDDAGAS